jgi:Fe-S-cluster containining protein
MPCHFLKDNRCDIYSVRPETCCNFPIYVLEDGLVSIQNIEACAKATHFNELFLDFFSKYDPYNYEKIIKSLDTEPPKDNSIKNPIRRAYLPINYVASFIIWLNKSSS